MSEPITLTERERAVFADWSAFLKGFKGEVTDDMAEMIDTWLGNRPAESASPPRVPGASAQSYEVGVESGPGQPMDICERLDMSASIKDDGDELIQLLVDDARDAAAEIRRLREQVQTERRAGIEAAARYHDEQAAEWNELRQEPKAREYDKQHRADAAAIRALADKPAPDAARKGG